MSTDLKINRALISGQPVTASVTANADISGQTVRITDTAGLPVETVSFGGKSYVLAWISGQPVDVTVNSTTNISGQPVRVSGESVRISGETIIAKISGETVVIGSANISGQTIYLASGQNPVQISGETVIGKISGETVIGQISGQTIYTTSGRNAVMISGQATKISGEGIRVRDPAGGHMLFASGTADGSNLASGGVLGRVHIYAWDRVSGLTKIWARGSGQGFLLVDVSGQPVDVSGATVIAKISGEFIIGQISGQTIYTASGSNSVQISGETVIGKISGETIIARISGQTVVAQISGETIRTVSGSNDVQISGQTVIAKVSGETVVSKISGETVIALISGQTVVANVTTNISGQTVYLASGQNAVQMSGQTVIAKISGETTVAKISGETVIALISGQTVVANVVTNISGQTVYLASGQNAVQMSGQTVNAKISGESVLGLSGTTIQVIVRDQAGDVATIAESNTDGASPTAQGMTTRTYTHIFDPDGNVWRRARSTVSGAGYPFWKLLTAISGETVVGKISGETVIAKVSGETVIALISGQTVVANVTTNISGQTVYTASGQNSVQISGQTVIAKISGETIIAKISGETVIASVSGQTVYFASGQNQAQISGQSIRLAGGVTPFTAISSTEADAAVTFTNKEGLNTVAVLYANDSPTGTSANNRRISTPLSGVSALAVGTLSGRPIVAAISGETVIAKISGEAMKISGEAVKISGEAVKVSGETLRVATPTIIRTANATTCQSISGGTELGSGAVISVLIRAHVSASGLYWVGYASGANAPNSGKGLMLARGDAVSIDQDNFNKIHVYAEVSGDRVTFWGPDY